MNFLSVTSPSRGDDRIETALYMCQTAPYRSLDLRGLTLPHWTISLVLEGVVTLTTGGRSYIVRPGDVMIHPPGISFSETNLRQGKHLWLSCMARLDGPSAEDLLDRFPVSPVVTLSGTQLDRYKDAFLRLESTHQSGTGASGFLLRTALLTELFAYIIDAWECAGSVARPEELTPPSGRFAPVLAYLRKHIADRITRNDLAGIAALHPTAFDRAFVKAVGQSPIRVLAEMRLTAARRLLETTDDTLESIAHAVGLGDAAHLSRVFRSRFGVAPGKWRDGVKQTKTGYIPPWSP